MDLGYRGERLHVHLKLGFIAGVAMLLMLCAPAGALAQDFVVNQTSDEPDDTPDGFCDTDDNTAEEECTLRAAIEEANDDFFIEIGFDETVFDGTAGTSTITLGLALPNITSSMRIDGGNCAPSGTAKPCVGLDAGNSGGDGLHVVQGEDTEFTDILGLAVHGAPGSGIAIQGDFALVQGNWLGIELDGGSDPNVNGIEVSGSDAQIGGTTGADRNTIGNNSFGLIINGGNGNFVEGNYFGVMADGSTDAGNDTNINLTDSATGNVIGGTVSSSAATTTTCDHRCNVIANGTAGVGFATVNEPQDTRIAGNFIGLDKTGASSDDENTQFGIDLGGADGVTIGGEDSRERNFITGGENGIRSFVTDTATGVVVKRNFVGLGSSGASMIDPPEGYGITVDSEPAGPPLISRNRLAATVGASDGGIELLGEGGRVVRNKCGIGKNGEDLECGDGGIVARGIAATIGEPGAGNTIGGVGSGGGLGAGVRITGSGEGNLVKANYIGRDSAGTPYANAGSGVLIDGGASPPPKFNVIGGGSTSENVISNSGGDAIMILGDVTAPSGNQIKRNRGKDNGGLFIDLVGTPGFGNGTGGPNGEVEAPEITDLVPSDTTRSHTKGECAPGSTIYVFRTSSPAGASPPRINAFVAKVTDSNMDGLWSASFSTIPSGQRLTALQIGDAFGDPSDGSSELALAVDPVVAP